MGMAYVCGLIAVTIKKINSFRKGNEVMLMTKQAFSPRSKYLLVLLKKRMGKDNGRCRNREYCHGDLSLSLSRR